MTHIKDYTGRRAHLIGIGGSSMSGLAGMLVKLGVRVTGSDSARSYTTDALEQSGIHVFIGQRAENVDGADIVIYSAAIAKSNPERVRVAARQAIRQKKLAEASYNWERELRDEAYVEIRDAQLKEALRR